MKQVDRILGISAPPAVIIYSLYHHLWKVLENEQDRIAMLAYAIKNFGRVCRHRPTKEEIDILPNGELKVKIDQTEIKDFLDLLQELKNFGDLAASSNILYRTLETKTEEEKITLMFVIFSPMFLPFEFKENYTIPPELDEDAPEMHAIHHEVGLADMLTISYDQFDYLLALMMKRYSGDINKMMFMIQQIREQAQVNGAVRLMEKLQKEFVEEAGEEFLRRLQEIDTTNLFSMQKPRKDEKPN